MLKEYVLGELNDHFPVEDGKIIAYSDGLHIYSMYFDLVDCLNVDKVKIGESAMADKERFIKENGV